MDLSEKSQTIHDIQSNQENLSNMHIQEESHQEVTTETEH